MLLLAVALGVFVWCLAVAMIALVERLARPMFGWALALGALLLVPALLGLWATRNDTSTAGAYAGFLFGLAAWAWHEVACAPRRSRRRGGFALQTSLAHELAWAVFVLLVSLLTWDGANTTARLTLPLLWALHASMRLNELARERASSDGPLVKPPWFAPGLPAAQPWSAIFPLTVTALIAATTLAADTALAHNPAGTSWALLTGVLAAGALAHWSIVIRLPAPVHTMSKTQLLAKAEHWSLPSTEEWRTALRSAPPLPREGDRG